MTRCLTFILMSFLTVSQVLAETVTFVCIYPSYSNEAGQHRSKEEFRLRNIPDGYLIDLSG
jgi:hypothetical protein